MRWTRLLLYQGLRQHPNGKLQQQQVVKARLGGIGRVNSALMASWWFEVCRGATVAPGSLFSASNSTVWVHQILGGGFQYLFMFTRYLGKMKPCWGAYFSNGLVQPPPLNGLVTMGSWCFLWTFHIWNHGWKGNNKFPDCDGKAHWPNHTRGRLVILRFAGTFALLYIYMFMFHISWSGL